MRIAFSGNACLLVPPSAEKTFGVWENCFPFVLPAHRKHFSSARDAPPKKRKLFRKGLAVTVNSPRTAAGGGVGCEKELESFRGGRKFRSRHDGNNSLCFSLSIFRYVVRVKVCQRCR